MSVEFGGIFLPCKLILDHANDKMICLLFKGIIMKKHLYIVTLAASLFISPLSFADSFSQIYQEYQSSQKTEDYGNTISLAEKLVGLGKTKFGEDNENTINLTYNLATAYAAGKQLQNAFDTMQLVVTDYESRYGAKSEKVFKAVLDQLNFIPKAWGIDPQKQKRVLKPIAKKAIEIATHLSEVSKEKAPYIYYHLIKAITRPPVIYQVKKEAVNYTELAYETMVSDLGKSDIRTLEVQLTLASLKANLRKNNRAIELYEDLVTNIDNQLNTSHPYELAARSRLVSLYEGKGQSEKATEHCIQIGKMTPWEQNLEPMPLFRIEPQYPIDYARAGKDGWAKMSFTIDEMGFVEDIEILDVEGGAKFGKESVKVLKKWRYAPKFENGQAVTAKNMTVQMDFKMGKPSKSVKVVN
jgi:TonB family protein